MLNAPTAVGASSDDPDLNDNKDRFLRVSELGQTEVSDQHRSDALKENKSSRSQTESPRWAAAFPGVALGGAANRQAASQRTFEARGPFDGSRAGGGASTSSLPQRWMASATWPKARPRAVRE